MLVDVLRELVLSLADILSRLYRDRPFGSAVSSPLIDAGTTFIVFKSSEKAFCAFPAKIRLMVLGAGIATVWVLIRSIYRTVELADGMDRESYH